MPRTPEKIVKWKTTDGREFEEELHATYHQRFLDMVERVKNQVDQFYHEGMPAADLAKVLVDYRVEMLCAYGA